MNFSGTKDSSERGIDPSPFTALTDVRDRSQYTIEPSSSQGCPPTRTPIVQMSSRSEIDEQAKFIRNPQNDLRGFCESAVPRQGHTNYPHACDYGANEQLWHRPLLKDDVVRLSSLLPLTSAFPAHLLLTGRSFLDSGSGSVATRTPVVLPHATKSKDQAFSSDGSSLSLDGYHKSKYFKDSTSHITQLAGDAHRESNADDNRIDVCNIKGTSERQTINPSTTIEDQDIERYEDNSDDDSNSMTSLFQLEGQCSRTVPGLLKYYSRHKWSLSSSLTVSLAVTGQSTPPSSPISPGTFQRPIVSSAQLNELTTTVNSCDEEIFKCKPTEPGLVSSGIWNSILPLSHVTKSSNRHAANNTKKHSSKSKPKLTNDDTNTDITKCEKSPNSIKMKSPNVISNLIDVDSPYRTGLPTIGMENVTAHFPLGASNYNPDEVSKHASWLLSQGIDPNVAARLGLGYQYIRDPVTGHIIILPNSHPLPSTNPGLLWTGYGSVATPPLLMTPQQLLLNDPHYRHPIHSHLLQMTTPPVQLDKTDNSTLKYQSQDLSQSTALPVLPSNLSSATLPPHILYPSNSLPCYLSTSGQQLLPINTQLDAFQHSQSSATTEISSTVTKSRKTCSPITATTRNDYSVTPIVVDSKETNLRFMQDPKYKVPFDNSEIEPPMDLTKKKQKFGDTSLQWKENHYQPISINTKSVSLTELAINVKKEIKQELMSPNQPILYAEKSKKSFEDVSFKQECSDITENDSSHSKEQWLTPLQLVKKPDQTTNCSHRLPTTATLDADDESQRMSSDIYQETMDISGLNLLSYSIQQHENNHQLSVPNSDEEISCIEMPKLKKFNLSPSPRHSPVSCELPPVLTPIETQSPMPPNFFRYSQKTVKKVSGVSSMSTQYSGLNLLCVLAEQELNEKSDNCSALSSLAEVAAAHESIKDPDGPSVRQLHTTKYCEFQEFSEIQSVENISDKMQQNDTRNEKNWGSSVDINRNYKQNWQIDDNSNFKPHKKKFKSSIEPNHMNGREIKVRIQIAEVRRKYRKKIEKLTKLHKKKSTTKKKHSSIVKLENSTELSVETSTTDNHSGDSLNGKSKLSQLSSPVGSNSQPTPNLTLQESETNKWCIKSSPLINFSVKNPGYVETSISDSDQHCSSKRKPGRPKRHLFGDNEIFNSNQNYDFMMISNKLKLLPNVRAEPKMREIGQIDENSDFGSLGSNNYLSDDDIPLSTFQQVKFTERYPNLTTSTKIKLSRSPKDSSVTRGDILKEELFRSLKRHSKIAAQEHDESDEDKYISEEIRFPFIRDSYTDEVLNNMTTNFLNQFDTISEVINTPNEILNNEALLLNLQDSEDSNVCKLNPEDLLANAAILYLEDGLLYTGYIEAKSPPDVYITHLEGSRNQPIYCRDQIYDLNRNNEMMKEVKPRSVDISAEVEQSSRPVLKEGTRICAFWSNCSALLAGNVSASPSLDNGLNDVFVNVAFDDNQVKDIHINDIRMLPPDFPTTVPSPKSLSLERIRRKAVRTSSFVKSLAESYSTPVRRVNQSTSSLPRVIDSDKPISQSTTNDNNTHGETLNLGQIPQVELGSSEVGLEIYNPPKLRLNSREELPQENSSNTNGKKPPKIRRCNSRSRSRITNYLPPDQIWNWTSPGKRNGRSKKIYHTEIVCGDEKIKIGDCTVLRSTNLDRPFIGQITQLYQSFGDMILSAEWFYHPSETNMLTKEQVEKFQGSLFKSKHSDNNDIQAISRLCYVVSFDEYQKLKLQGDGALEDVFYLAGTYDPFKQIITIIPQLQDSN